MDSLTQIVLGGAVAELVAGKKMGNKAIFWGALAGTIPDLDVFFRAFYHPIDAALLHRGFSHSILFSIVFGPLFAWIFFQCYKKKYTFMCWLNLFFWSFITHPILDMFTNYGTQFLWPLDVRITFNTIFVIDPLYTLPFLVCLVWVLFLKRDNPKRFKINLIGIIYSSVYLLWGVVVKLILLSQTHAVFSNENISVNRSMVTPMPLTSFYWYTLGEDDSTYYVYYTSIFNGGAKKIERIPKGNIRLENLKWKDVNYTDKLNIVSDGYYLLEQKNDTISYYDLRFGFTGKLTGEKVNKPVMGYQFITKNNAVQKAEQMNRGEAFKFVDFHYYFKRVFGN